MHIAYLLIGGNLGNRLDYLRQARELIGQRAGRILAISSIYETAAWGNTGQDAFLNQVIVIGTEIPAPELMNLLLSIEEQIGRKRAERYGPRTIDIDMLYYDQEIHETMLVRIPHPEIQRRRFALVPLAEIAPAYIHPELGKTNLQLLMDCNDPLDVKKI